MIGVVIHNSVSILRLFLFWGLVSRFSDSYSCLKNHIIGALSLIQVF